MQRRTPILVLVAACAGLIACGRSTPPRGGEAGSRAEAVVVASVDAYNRRDLEAFLATLAPDARLYEFPDRLIHQGHDELRRVYGTLFASAPALRAEVHQRVVQGRFVIDRETTTGMPGKGPLVGVAIYEVIDGRIARIWFVD